MLVILLTSAAWAAALSGAFSKSEETTTALDTLPSYVEPTTSTVAPPPASITSITSVPPITPISSTMSIVPPTVVPPFQQTGDLRSVCASIAGDPLSASFIGPVDTVKFIGPIDTTKSPVPTGCRLVAYYGNPNSKGLGPMGQSPAPQMLDALTALTRSWQEADPRTPTRCALQLIAIVAQGSPGQAGLHRGRASAATIDKVIGWGRERGCLTILDVQVGFSQVADEVAYLEPWLAMPDVHLALDPEWDMPPGVKPGSQIGTMSAADINLAIEVLDRLAVTNKLGPRLLIVHRFRDFMVTDPELIKPTPNIRLVVNMDGFGLVAEKLSSYLVAQKGMPTGLTGMKLFFKLDRPLLGPSEVLNLRPAPVFVNYQ